jgi:hypothetical protein
MTVWKESRTNVRLFVWKSFEPAGKRCTRPQKSEAMPLFSQSPYLVGSGPLGPCSSLGEGFALASARSLRASASARARLAAGESDLRSDADLVEAGGEGFSVIDDIPVAG